VLEEVAQARRTEHSRTRELRLAVVLYGGVSLAIYMHGTTKEIHRLVKASADDATAPSDGQLSPTERVYRHLLERVGALHPEGVRTRVVVDVIAGTSAGGINGVYLAKAIVHDQSQEALRDVWLQRGDIGQLLLGPDRVPWKVRAPWRLARLPWRAPLDGDAMSRWLHEALVAMDNGGSSPNGSTLMPPEHRLDLFITTTDLRGYERDMVIDDPPLVHERGHRHVLGFRYGDGSDDFTAADNPWLAFASRVTSSFPGAFAAVSPASFAKSIGVSPAALGGAGRFFRMYQLSGAESDSAFFVDGGVLDNRPFGHAIRAIRSRPADCEVDRRLVYLEPDPTEDRDEEDEKPPTPFATILASVVGVPRKEPIFDDILEVTRHNERVDRIRDVIERAFPAIAARVEAVVGGDLGALGPPPSAEVLAGWRQALETEACAAAGISYPTYVRSKVSGVVDRYARTVCALSDYPEDCNQAAFVRAALRAWGRETLLGEETDADARVAFLRRFDLDYGIRRMRFVIDALSWWLEQPETPGLPPRDELASGKAVLYKARARLDDAAAGKGLDVDLTGQVADCFSEVVVGPWVGRPDEYVEDHAEQLGALQVSFGDALDAQLADVGEEMHASLQQVMAEWSPAIRRDLLVRYLGFPLWDAVLYPIQALSDVGERDVVDVVRFSPKDVGQLDVPDRELAGKGKGHFGAFLDAAGRERDYLLGRLDGAERLIGLVLGEDPPEGELARWSGQVFAAIVQEEREHLPRAVPLLDAVARCAAVLESA
jgi:patatin-related protein